MAISALSLSAADRRIGTIALMIAAGMQAADATIVNVALPHLERDLGGGVALGAWVMTSYLCATAVLAPLTGWLRRHYGARRLFAGAVTLFVAASLSCALAPSALALVLLRLLQGVAGGVIPPMTQAILLDLYPSERHGRILGIWGATTMAGPIMGPVLGGIISDAASWRWVFAINLPIGLFILWGAWRVLSEGDRRDNLPFDGVGLLLLIAGIGALQLLLERGIGHSWFHSPELIAELAVSLSAMLGLAARARVSRLTIVRLGLLRDRNFSAAAFYNFTTSALLFTTLVFIPALAEGPLGYPATVAGLTIVPRAVLMMLAMLLVGRAIGVVDVRLLLAIGWFLMALGLLLLADARPPHDLAWIVAGSTVQAVGAGMLFTPLSTLAFLTLQPERRTEAAGLYSLLRQLGCACGVALMTAVLRIRIEADLANTGTAVAGTAAAQIALQRAAGVALLAYADCFRIMAAVALAVMPGIFVFGGGRRPRGPEVESSPTGTAT